MTQRSGTAPVASARREHAVACRSAGRPRTVAVGAACIGCSIALGCGGAVASGALAPALSTLAAAIPLVWVFGPLRLPIGRRGSAPAAASPRVIAPPPTVYLPLKAV